MIIKEIVNNSSFPTNSAIIKVDVCVKKRLTFDIFKK